MDTFMIFKMGNMLLPHALAKLAALPQDARDAGLYVSVAEGAHEVRVDDFHHVEILRDGRRLFSCLTDDLRIA